MAPGRTFAFSSADLLWWNLEPLDWIAAFGNGLRAEPRGATPEQLAALERAGEAYRERFAYSFVWHQPGAGVEQMLAAIEQRLGNDPDRELRVAAEEKRKHTRHKLEKLIG